MRLRVKEIAIPNTQQAHDHWQVLFHWGIAEVLVHGMAAGQHGFEMIHTDGQCNWQTNRRPQRITSAHPIPKAEHIRRVDAEGFDFFGASGDGDKMFRNGSFGFCAG